MPLGFRLADHLVRSSVGVCQALDSSPVAVCAVVSFRLGLSDGVSIVAATWQQVLRDHGWETYSVAGDGPVDHVVDSLAIDAAPELAQDRLEAELRRVLARADVVLVENLLSIPMNLTASRALAAVLAGRPAVLHHHDPPWQRERFAHVTELPPNDPLWHHVTINRMTQRQFHERGFDAITIYNGFDPHPPPGDRERTRAALGLAPETILGVHPVRAIARKNIPKAIEIAERLGAVYWLPNPAEEGYDDELERVLDRADCPVLRTPVERTGLSMSDLYAASDLVLFPSLWEGFGNPPIEAAIHRRPAVVGHYPVAAELRELGFHWFDPDDMDTIAKALKRPRTDILERNRRIASEHLSVERMGDEVKRLFDKTGPIR